MIAEAYLKKRYQAGQRQNDAKWRAWYERSQEAKRQGQEFDEPPPFLEDARAARRGRTRTNNLNQHRLDLKRAIKNQRRWVIATVIATASVVALIAWLLG